jgi:hypothetical protein
MQLFVTSGTKYPDPEVASLNTHPRQALSILVRAGAAPLLHKCSTSKTKLCRKLNNGPHKKLNKKVEKDAATSSHVFMMFTSHLFNNTFASSLKKLGIHQHI